MPPPPSKRPLDQPNLAGLDALIAPRSVAVIGASDDPDRIGGRPLSYMKAAEFRGQIFPVNPNRSSVQGIAAYPSIRDVPTAPDACVVAVQASLVPGVLEECAERGSKAAVVFSAGFAETGDEGRRMQERLTEIGGRTGMRILGPNCLGVFNARTGWMGTFASPFRQAAPVPGPISIASQSGAVGSELFSHIRRRGLAIGTWITTGNEADVDVADAIAFLVEDGATEVVVAYAEGVGRGRALRMALERAAEAGKPVIFMKTGRSRAGAAAVQSHTAALAGVDRVYSALFRQLGVIRVRTFEDLVDAAYISTFPQRRQQGREGKRLAIVTISGGVGVQMADAAADAGLDVPELSPAAQRDLKTLVPFASGRNPGDVTAQVFNDLGLVSRYLRIMLDDGDFDAAVLFLTMVVASEDTSRRLIAELDAVMAEFAEVPLVISLLAPAPITELYESAGYPVFQDPTRAVEAAAILCRRSDSRRPAGHAPVLDVPASAARLKERRAGRGASLSEDESMRILEGWGVPCASRRVARTEEQALSAAKELGGRVALKLSAPSVQHKSDVGGVLLNVEGESAVRDGYQTLVARGAALGHRADDASVLVAAMAPVGVEAVVGVSHDATFGPVVMVGLGGVLVEVLDDVAFRLAPFGVDEARRMIDELKGARLFHGFRGAPAADVDALAALLARVSVFAAAEEGSYTSVDLNPVRVLPRGQDVVVLDALIELPT